jgi:hypothetical protein
MKSETNYMRCDVKTIYICHPFANDPKGNIERVTKICKAIKREVVPIAPHLMLPAYIDEDTERELALEHGLVLLKGCDELWMYGVIRTDGMSRELARAIELNISVEFKSYKEDLNETNLSEKS